MALKAGYRQTEIGPLPDDWDVKPLAKNGEVLIGLTYAPSDVRPYGILVLRSSNIQKDALVFDDNVFVDMEIPERIMVRPGDVLICVRNGSRNLIGKTALLDEHTNGMTFGAFMAVFRSDHGQYFNHLFRSHIMKHQIEEHLGATINQITNKSLKSFQIPVPPTGDEIDAIATALSDADALLEGLDQLIAKKRDLKQAAMQQLLTGETRLEGFSGEWEVKRLGEIAVLNRLNVVPALQPDKQFVHFSLPAFDAGRKAQSESGASIGSNKFGIPPAAVLVSKLNPRIPRIWAPVSVPDNAVASTEWLVLTPKGGVDRQYLFVLCSSPLFCEQMKLAATGTTGSHQRISPNLALDIQMNFATDLDEQTAIAAVLSDMDAEIEALEQRRAKTADLKQAMMQELLTGRTRLV